jgi:hypothetical protein
LSSNEIDNEGIIDLAEALRKNSILTHLNLSNNKLLRRTPGSNPYAEFVNAVAENTSLESLWLQSNELGPSVGTLLGKMLNNHPTLKELNLMRNNLGAASSEIIDSLEGNHVMEVLNLSYNAMDRSAVRHLSDALTNHPSLYELDISGSSIPIVAMVNEMDFLRENTSLESLVVSVSMHGWADDEEELIGSVSGLLENNLTLLNLKIYRHGNLSSNQLVRNATMETIIAENRFFRNHLCGRYLADGLLPHIFAKVSNTNRLYHCLRSRIDLVVSGLQSRDV